MSDIQPSAASVDVLEGAALPVSLLSTSELTPQSSLISAAASPSGTPFVTHTDLGGHAAEGGLHGGSASTGQSVMGNRRPVTQLDLEALPLDVQVGYGLGWLLAVLEGHGA